MAVPVEVAVPAPAAAVIYLARTLRLFVKTPQGTAFAVDADPDAPVAVLQALVAAQSGVEPARQLLMLAQQVLDPGRLVKDYALADHVCKYREANLRAPRAAHCPLPTAHRPPRAAHRPLPTAHRPPPTARRPPCAAYRPMLTAHRPPPPPTPPLTLFFAPHAPPTSLYNGRGAPHRAAGGGLARAQA